MQAGQREFLLHLLVSVEQLLELLIHRLQHLFVLLRERFARAPVWGGEAGVVLEMRGGPQLLLRRVVLERLVFLASLRLPHWLRRSLLSQLVALRLESVTQFLGDKNLCGVGLVVLHWH